MNRSIVFSHIMRFMIFAFAYTGMPVLVMPSPAQAATGTTPSNAETELLEQRATLEQEIQSLTHRLNMVREKLKALDAVSASSGTNENRKPQASLKQEEVEVLEAINVVSTKIQQLPEGVTRSVADRNLIDNQPAKDFRESLESLPGIVLRQRNGPRDFSIAIRGFGAKQSFGVRKLKLFEDGFDITQSDGLSRLDLQDPWFMKNVVVERGASSALYGNFALGGMVNFVTRRGADIDGVETFTSAGSYGYQKYAAAIGKEFKYMDAAVFMSHERGDGFREHSEFATTTVDANFRFNIDDKQTFFVKVANNDLDVNTPQRLTLSQFETKPKQAGSGAKRADRSRRDHRTIIGAKYAYQVNSETEASFTGVYDNKDINQKFGITLDQIQPNWKTRADIRHANTLFGMPLRSHAGIFFDYMESESNNFRNSFDFFGTKQSLINNARGSIRSLGFRLREEIDLSPHWTLAGGMGFERSEISILQVNFDSTATVTGRANANRAFTNVVPDVSLVYHPNEHAQYWTRFSGGYGIPSLGNLTTTPAGLPGENLALDDERNYNIELGTNTFLHPTFRLELVGFWTFFQDELISQTVLGGTGTFTTNADSSEYRGIEVGWEWVPLDGLNITGAYTFIDAKFINFTDTISVGGIGTAVNRDGKTVPAIEPHVFNVRAAYDHHSSGFGGWMEVSWLDDYFVNNANTLKAQAATVVNVNLHYARQVNRGWLRFIKAYVQIDNLLDQTYMGSAAIVSDSTPDISKQAFLMAPPLSIFGGITLGLF